MLKKRTFTVLVVLVSLSSMAQADNYGVIFSGGVNPYNNWQRYYEETHRIWDVMTVTLGYNASNVYVLAADGTDLGADQHLDAGGYISSDWSAITGGGSSVVAGTYGNLQSTLTGLRTTITPDDCFHFWSFDHGYGGTLDSGGLCAWDDGTGYLIPDDVFAGWVNPIDAYAESYAFGQCFAGDMVNELNILPGENRFAAWAADWYESSYGKGWVDVWADALEAGLVWTYDLGEYARLQDPYGPGGMGLEHPGWLGDNFHIITNQPVPVPGAVLLGILGLSVAGLKLRKFA